jgi:hypothetical protein
MIRLSATRCSCITILWVSIVSFAAITLCVPSQQVFIVVVYFVIVLVQKLFGNTIVYMNVSNIVRQSRPCALIVHHATKARYSSTHSWLSTRWRWVVSFTSRPLHPQGKSPKYPLHRRLGGPQSWSERDGEEKNSQPLPKLEPPIIQSVIQPYTTELSLQLVAITKCI